MSKGVNFSIGFVVGLGVALLFLVWAVPEFRQVEFGIEYYDAWNNNSDKQDGGYSEENGTHSWLWLYRLIKFDDSLAQWLMVALALATAIISAWAVKRVTETMNLTRDIGNVTRDIGEKQVRAYISLTNGHAICTKDGEIEVTGKFKNFGQSPAGRIDWVATLDFVIDSNEFETEKTAVGCSYDSVALAASQSVPMRFVFRDTDIKKTAFDSGKISFDFSVLFRYEDVFDNRHKIRAFSARNGSGMDDGKLTTIHHQKSDEVFPSYAEYFGQAF